MTATHSGKPWTTNKSQHVTSGEPFAPSDVPTKNHPSGHTDEANASHAKGTTMADLYNLEKTVESIEKQIAVICQMLGIDPTPLQEPTNPDA
jgi:hypothetical protein